MGGDLPAVVTGDDERFVVVDRLHMRDGTVAVVHAFELGSSSASDTLR